MTLLTTIKLQTIKARCDAANTILLPAPEMIAALLLKGISREDTFLYGYSHYDIPALLAHIGKQTDALAKAEADKAVLIEALDKTTSVLDIINDRMPGGTYYKKYEPLANDALMKASAALARVKGE